MGSGARKADKSKQSMHDGKNVVKDYGQAWKIANLMTLKRTCRFVAYECRWGDDGVKVSKRNGHFHVGTQAGEGIKKYLNDWDSEIPEGSKWV